MDVVCVFGGVLVELFEQIHDLNEGVAARNIFGVAVSVVTFAIHVNRFLDIRCGFANVVVDETFVIWFVASFFHSEMIWREEDCASI